MHRENLLCSIKKEGNRKKCMEVKDGWLRRVDPRATRQYDFHLIGYVDRYNFSELQPAGSRGCALVHFKSGARGESFCLRLALIVALINLVLN